MTQELKNYIEKDNSKIENFQDIQLGKRGPTNTLFYNEKIVIVERQDKDEDSKQKGSQGVVLPEGFFDNKDHQKRILKQDKRNIVTMDHLEDERKLDMLEEQLVDDKLEDKSGDQKKVNMAKELMDKDTDYQLSKVKDRIAKLREKRRAKTNN